MGIQAQMEHGKLKRLQFMHEIVVTQHIVGQAKNYQSDTIREILQRYPRVVRNAAAKSTRITRSSSARPRFRHVENRRA
jgi:hypothetical protein